MTETWLAVAGFEGLYEVSDLGNVRSLDRTVNRGGHQMRRSGKQLNPQESTGGYYQVSLAGQLFCVHRLVAVAFIRGDRSLEANHKNGEKADNRAVNLEWLSHSENMKHAHRDLPRKLSSMARQVILLKGCRAVFCPSIADAARFLSVHQSSPGKAIRAGGSCKGWEVTYG